LGENARIVTLAGYFVVKFAGILSVFMPMAALLTNWQKNIFSTI